MKTINLKGAALDWAVHYALHGQCEGYSPYEYSTDWSQGGPIIEREGIDLYQSTGRICAAMWENISGGGRFAEAKDCSTPLIAAMRCYVASKLGDDVEIPKGLV